MAWKIAYIHGMDNGTDLIRKRGLTRWRVLLGSQPNWFLFKIASLILTGIDIDSPFFVKSNLMELTPVQNRDIKNSVGIPIAINAVICSTHCLKMYSSLSGSAKLSIILKIYRISFILEIFSESFNVFVKRSEVTLKSSSFFLTSIILSFSDSSMYSACRSK